MKISSFTISRLLFLSAICALIGYLFYRGEYSLDLFRLSDWQTIMFMIIPGLTAFIAMVIALVKTILARKELKGFNKYWPFYFLLHFLIIGFLSLTAVMYGYWRVWIESYRDVRITPPTFQDFGISQTYTYHDFNFPFPLSEDEVTDSLMNKSIIVVDNPTRNQIEALMVSVFSNAEWETIGYDFSGDGTRTKYWKSDEKPAVEIFYKEGYGSVEIKFIHPKDIPSWR